MSIAPDLLIGRRRTGEIGGTLPSTASPARVVRPGTDTRCWVVMTRRLDQQRDALLPGLCDTLVDAGVGQRERPR